MCIIYEALQQQFLLKSLLKKWTRHIDISQKRSKEGRKEGGREGRKEGGKERRREGRDI